MKDHEIAALISQLTRIGLHYGQTQQLRERIASVLVPVLVQLQPLPAVEIGPISFRSPTSVSPSFNVAEYQAQEVRGNQADREAHRPDLYRVDMGALGEIYVKPEVACARFAQLKRERAPVKAVYPMYQGAALSNEYRAIAHLRGSQP